MLKKLLSFFKPRTKQPSKTTLFSPEELKTLDFSNIPKQVAIIPDGNRRWAKHKAMFTEQGHEAGAETVLDIIKAADQLGIKTLTFYIFSTENWLRPKSEINAQFRLLEKYLIDQRQNMLDNGVKFKTIGELSKFPPHLVKLVEETKQATEECHNITTVFAMNYGSRDELRRTFISMLDDYEKGKIKREEISEQMISHYLDTSEWKDPDLLIRTGGERRMSNFLLWQLSYSEIYNTEVYWPDFKPQHLLESVREFQKRNRRRGR